MFLKKINIPILLVTSFLLSSCAARPMQPMVIEPQYIDPQAGTTHITNMPIERISSIRHEVGPGETVWRISKMYGVTVDDIVKANRLKDKASLEIGQKLVIPNAQKEPSAVIALYDTRPWEYIIVHHTATQSGKALTVNSSHLKRGFKQIGYHFLISNGTQGKPDGFIEVSPRWLTQSNGAHCRANRMNQRAIGVCLVGNFSNKGEKVTAKQMDSLIYLLSNLQKHYKIPDSKVVGHGHVYGAKTECPGIYFPWKELKEELSKY